MIHLLLILDIFLIDLLSVSPCIFSKSLLKMLMFFVQPSTLFLNSVYMIKNIPLYLTQCMSSQPFLTESWLQTANETLFLPPVTKGEKHLRKY